jgi:hypothetical protein
VVGNAFLSETQTCSKPPLDTGDVLVRLCVGTYDATVNSVELDRHANSVSARLPYAHELSLLQQPY